MNNNCVVSDSLLWKGEEKFLSLADQRRFCLGIPGWCPCINCTEPEMATIDPGKPLGRKRRTAGSSASSSTGIKINDDSNLEPVAKKVSEKVEDRFLFDVTSEELENFMEGECPKNTTKNNEWAMRNFKAWRDARNERYPEDLCPDVGLFHDKKIACKWLCRYVSETRKSDGTEYTPRSLYLILAGLQRHLRKMYPDKEFNFFLTKHLYHLRTLVIRYLKGYIPRV